jgi:hypothetical protein
MSKSSESKREWKQIDKWAIESKPYKISKALVNGKAVYTLWGQRKDWYPNPIHVGTLDECKEKAL